MGAINKKFMVSKSYAFRLTKNAPSKKCIYGEKVRTKKTVLGHWPGTPAFFAIPSRDISQVPSSIRAWLISQATLHFGQAHRPGAPPILARVTRQAPPPSRQGR